MWSGFFDHDACCEHYRPQHHGVGQVVQSCPQVVQGEGRREELECPVCTEEMIPPKQIFQVFLRPCFDFYRTQVRS